MRLVLRRGQRVLAQLDDGAWRVGEVVGASPRPQMLRIPATPMGSGPWQVVRRRPYVSVWFPGFSAPHDLDPRRVRVLKPKVRR